MRHHPQTTLKGVQEMTLATFFQSFFLYSGPKKNMLCIFTTPSALPKPRATN